MKRKLSSRFYKNQEKTTITQEEEEEEPSTKRQKIDPPPSIIIQQDKPVYIPASPPLHNSTPVTSASSPVVAPASA
jgi:hypothetical protein